MKTRYSMAVALVWMAAIAMTASAHDGQAQAGEVVTRFNQVLPNVPGKSMIAVEVTLAPGQVSVPHHHAKSAFIMAYVLSGTIRSQVEGEPARDYSAGETWLELPGAHHIQAENLSKTEPARLLAVFILDSDDQVLTTLDPL